MPDPTPSTAAAISAVGAPVVSVTVAPSTAASRSNALSPGFQITGNAPAQRAIAISAVPLVPPPVVGATITPNVAVAVSSVPFTGITGTGGAVAYASATTATVTNGTSVAPARPAGLVVGDLILLLAAANAAPITATAPGGAVLLDDLGNPVLWDDGTEVTIGDAVTSYSLVESVIGAAAGGGILYDDAGSPVMWDDGTPVMLDAQPATLLDDLGNQVFWDDATAVLFEGGESAMTSWLWRKVADASDLAAATIPIGFDRAASGVAIATRYTGEDPTAPVQVFAHASGVSQVPQSAPAVTTTESNGFVVRMATWASLGTPAPPSMHTQRATASNFTQAAVATLNAYAAAPGPLQAVDYLNGLTTAWTHWTVVVAQPLVGNRSVSPPGAVRAVSGAPRPSVTASGSSTPLTAAAVSTVGGGFAPVIMGLVATPIRAAAHSAVGTPTIGGGAFGAGVAANARVAAAVSGAARPYPYWRAPLPTLPPPRLRRPGVARHGRWRRGV